MNRPRNFQDVLSRLPGARQSGDSWKAPCPAPGHKTPAKHLTLKDAGDKALVTCHPGHHTYQDICQALGFESLTYSPNGNGPGIHKQRTPVATFPYEYESGSEAYQIRRFNLGNGDKTFEVRHKKDGQYVSGMGDYDGKPILYHQPEIPGWIAAAQRIYIPEGELKADLMISNGGAATTSPFGAGPNKWRPQFSESLRGARVVILCDNDKPGHDFAQDKAASLYGKVASLKILELPGLPAKGDIVDWFKAGSTFEELERLANEAPEWTPSSEAARDRFRLTPLADLLSEPAESTPYLWADTLPTGGISILAAKPKVGKTTVGLNLALRVARGEDFLDRGTTAGPVVYLALEEKRSEIAAHFVRMGAGEEEISIHTGSAPEEALVALDAAIRETGAVLAVVDPLQRLIRLHDGNDYTEVTRALEPLMIIARSSGCHIMLIHHLGKGGDQREGGDGILGSTALFGGVDTALIMRRREDGRTIESIQRYGTDLPRTLLTLDPVTGLVEANGTVEEMELARVAAAICETLGEGDLTEKELRETLAGNTGLVGKALRWLHQEGYVRREGAGKRGAPYLYILVSRFSYIDKREKQENEKPSPSVLRI